MSPVATRSSPAPLRNRGIVATVLITVLAAALALLVVVPATRSPAFVDRITVVNPHPWSVEVAVAGEEGGAELPIASVGRERSHTVHDVLDQGRSWSFTFAYGGVDGGQLVISRSELERTGWTITVPEGFAARMRMAGMGPSKQ